MCVYVSEYMCMYVCGYVYSRMCIHYRYTYTRIYACIFHYL